jgi:glycosyltransferase involved in cell wall biosynthesis
VTLTIGIKALNEEKHIAAALRSALDAAAPHGGEVVLADSGSRDRTVAIAQALPVRVAQLADAADRSCGAGAQLAWQASRAGEWFCLIDGDMTLAPGFVDAAIAYLRANPQVAGVGGAVEERNLETEEFRIRNAAMAYEPHRRPGLVDRLDGGGVYRRAAIAEVCYFSDRNLRSFEEFDLAVRLAAKGWKLARIAVPAVAHFGHTGSGYRLLWRRLTSGQLSGAGEVLRGAVGRAHLPLVLRRLGHVRRSAAIVGWWIALVLLSWGQPLAALALLVAPFAFLAVRRRSLSLGFFSFCLWNFTAVGVILGLLRRRVPPTQPLAMRDLSGPSA